MRIGYSQVQLNPLINDNAKNAWEATHFFDNLDVKTLLKIPTHLEIFTWALLFKILGNNTFAYNLLCIIQYIILSIFFYLVIKKVACQKVAVVCNFLLAFSPPIFTLNSVFWSAHSRGLMFSWIIFYLCTLMWEKPTQKRFLLLAFLSGLAAVISMPTALIALVASFIVLFLKDRKIFLKRDFFMFLIVFVVAVLVFYNFNIPCRGAYLSINKAAAYNLNIKLLHKFFREVLISFTSAGTNSTYQLKAGFQNGLKKIIYFYGLIFSLSAAAWLYQNRKIIFKAQSPILIFPLYLFLFFFVFALSPASEGVSRYYLPVITFYVYFLSEGLVKLIDSKVKKLKNFGFFAMFLIFGFSTVNNLNFYPSAYKGIFELIKFAQENNIKAIFTNYHMQFAIVFYSQEKISASSPADPMLNSASKFDAIARNSPSLSYLFEDRKSQRFKEYLTEQKIDYRQRNFNNLVLYYNLSRRPLSTEFNR